MQDPLCYVDHSYIQENFTKLKRTIDPTVELVNQLLAIPELRTHVSLEDMNILVSPDQRNACLLRGISQLSPDSVSHVIRALRDNDQPHAASLMSGPSRICGNDQGPMSDKHWMILEYLQLKTDLSKKATAQHVDVLVDVLTQNGVFQRRDIHRITSHLTSDERMKEILEIVMRKWDGAFDIFMVAAEALGIIAFENREIDPAEPLTQIACDDVHQTSNAATTNTQHQTHEKTAKSQKRTSVGQGENRRWLLAWFKRLLDEETVPGLRWMDESHRKFYLPWPAFNQAGNSPQNPDGVLFLEYAKQTGKYCEGDKPDFSTWKQNLRNAITKSKEIKFAKNDENKHNCRIVELRNFPVAPQETKSEAVSSPTSTSPAAKPVVPDLERLIENLSTSLSGVLLNDVEMLSQKEDSCERNLASCRQQQVDATSGGNEPLATVGVEGDMNISISAEFLPTADFTNNPADIGDYGLPSAGGILQQQQQHSEADSFPENIFDFHASRQSLNFIASNTHSLY